MEAVNIAHLLDPKRPDHARAGMHAKPREYAELGRLGIKNYKGIALGLVEPSRDPLSAKVLCLEAPAEFRDAVAQAEARYTDAQTLCEQTKQRWENALEEKARFSSDMAGSNLTPAGVQSAIVLNGAIDRAERSYREAEELQQQARIERLHAETALENWARGERLRREDEARRAAEAAKNPPAAPLSERLSKLKKKVTGKQSILKIDF